jgi:hypothetical protein
VNVVPGSIFLGLVGICSLAAFAQAICPSDCNGDGEVRVDELATSINIALQRNALSQCPSSDPDSNGSVGIADLLRGVDAAIHGCPLDPEPTPTLTDLRTELQRNRELWDGTRLPSHQYNLRRGCFCPPPNFIEVRVVNREVREIVDPDSGEPIEMLDSSFPVTIDDLFDLLDDAIDWADFVDVEYHEYGSPIRIEIDYNEKAVDDEVSFLLSDLRFYRGGDCRYSSDCDRFDSQCLEPGGVLGCGYCVYQNPRQCTVDDDCKGEGICRRYPVPCHLCSGGPLRTCREDCVSDEECREGESCGGDGHCSAVPCVTSADCIAHFDCAILADASSGVCERRHCGRDADCDDGFCVGRKCYDQLGRCEVIPS